MEWTILANLLIILVILFVFINQFILKRKEYNKRIHIPIYILLLIYFFGFILNLLWITNIIEYSYTDFYYIFSGFILIQSLAFFKIFYSFKKTKKWFFLFLLFILIIIAPFVYIKTTLFIISLSYLLMIFLFNFFIKNPDLKRTSLFGLGYSSISLLLISLLLIKPEFISFFWILSNLFFVPFIYVFLKEIKKIDIHSHLEKKPSYLTEWIRYFVFILVLTNFIFIGTASVHELGHLASSKLLDCEYQRIVYEKDLPRTEILCSDDQQGRLSIIGGLVIPLLLGLLLILGGGKFIKETALLIIGFNFMISYKDFMDLGMHESVSVLIVLIGGIFAVIGIGLLAKSRTEEEKIEEYFETDF